MSSLFKIDARVFENPQASGYRLIFWLIIVAGLALRLFAAMVGEGYHYFAIGDELDAYGVALAFLHGDTTAYYIGQPTFAGGQAPGPWWTVFWIALLKLGGDSVPRAIIGMALFNTLAIGLIYRLAQQFLNPAYALFACLWFALAPWPVYYAVGMWNPMTMAVLGSLLFLSLWQVARVDNSKWIIVVGLIAALLPQFHMIGLFYIPAIVLILWIAPTRIHRGYLLLACLLGVAIYLPYLIGEMTHHWSNLRAILSGQDTFDAGVLKILTAPLTVLSNLPGRWAGDDIQESLAFANHWFGSYLVLITLNILSVASALIVTSYFVVKFASHVKTARGSLPKAFQRNPVTLFIGILLILPVLLFVLTGHNFSTRYTVVIFPLLFMLPAYYLQHAPRNRWRTFVTYSLPLTLATNIYLSVAFFTQQHLLIAEGDYLVCSFAKLETLRDSIKAHAGADTLVQIDPTPYFKHSKFEKLFINGNALAFYMREYETYLGHPGKTPEHSKTYVLAHDDQAAISPERIAWRGNGAVIYLQASPSGK